MTFRKRVSESFRQFSHLTSQWVGSPLAFALAIISVTLWLFSGPVFHYSDTWQLVINTATTIITFLMVFLIQNAQNRDARAIHLKLDELIRSIGGARNNLLNLEEFDDEELTALQEQFKKLKADVDCHIEIRQKKHKKKPAR
jgi:low affinity Fe/Cu permease